MTVKVAVEFVRANAPYSPGDVATFSKERAAILVGCKAAKYPDAPAAPAEKAMAPKMTGVVKTYSKK